MNIFLDRCVSHIAVRRMLPHWVANGNSNWMLVDPIGCDVQLSLIRIVTETNLPCALRLDGIYYDTATDYKKRNEKISEAHIKADAIIYQSEFCRHMCERYLAKRKEGAVTRIIYNGIDENWCGEHIHTDAFDVIVIAKWRRHKRLQEIIEIFKLFLEDHNNVRLHVIGDLVENKREDNPNIIYHGQKEYESLEAIFKIADVSLHLSKKDCCPNSVVEVIGAGIPVITTSVCGGAMEMCGMVPGCWIALETDTLDPCSHYTDEYNKLSKDTRDQILYLLHTIYMARHRVKQPVELSARHMANKYLEVFKEIIK